MPVLQRRAALVLLFGIFLIPLSVSSLQGLTQVVTCRERAELPFTVVMPGVGQPTVITAASFRRGETPGRLCPGITLNMRVGWDVPGRVKLLLPVQNSSVHPWAGTVAVRLGGVTSPVPVGRVGPGTTRVTTLHVITGAGTRRLTGTLYVGP